MLWLNLPRRLLLVCLRTSLGRVRSEGFEVSEKQVSFDFFFRLYPFEVAGMRRGREWQFRRVLFFSFFSVLVAFAPTVFDVLCHFTSMYAAGVGVCRGEREREREFLRLFRLRRHTALQSRLVCFRFSVRRRGLPLQCWQGNSTE
ncbi:hypothetical protein DQ04_09921010 [Trypanosoma grayi]|uniref:hypothetical protein n=1 Tax=Trypanosoma grayi TaxID=71804 RepID=UPI0004F4475F|nr:hypothetical protein DQ04_09921010 [Trypanosoma grayi]KEG07397.1 hypothetical protein DQ04_09921010 [Trypanosoma grayi]